MNDPEPETMTGLLLPALLLAAVVLSIALFTDCRADARQVCRERGGVVEEVDDWFRCEDPEQTPP